MKHLIIALAAILVAGPLAVAQGSNIGFVDIERATQSIPLYEEMIEARDRRVSAIEDTNSELEDVLQEQLIIYEQSKLTASEASLEMQAANIEKMRRDLEGFRHDGQSDINMWTAEQEAKLASHVREMVETVRAERGLAAVLNIDSALAVDPSADLTDVVIERLGGSVE